MEENRKEQNRKQLLLQKISRMLEFIILFFAAGGIAGAGSYFYKQDDAQIICNIIMVMLGTGIVIFALVSSEINQMYFYQNQGKYGKFILFYLLSLALALVFPLLPASGWPFLTVFVILSLFSNSITGLIAGSVSLMLAVTLADVGTYREFMLYFFSGLVGIMVFSRLDEEFKVGIPIFISLSCLTICLSANIVLFEQERLSISQYTFVAINLMVNVILLFIVLKIFSSSMIHRYQEKYMDLNDPECPLLVQLKEMSKDEYYHAIHTAYLSDKIARRLGLDEMVAKSCGYYHRIGLLRGENTWEHVEAIAKSYHMPPEAREVLRQYVDPKHPLVAREAVVVLFADAIVSSIYSVFSKNPKAEIDYDQVIESVYRKKMGSGELLKSEISIAQLREMRKIFAEEKLYYDFLR